MTSCVVVPCTGRPGSLTRARPAQHCASREETPRSREAAAHRALRHAHGLHSSRTHRRRRPRSYRATSEPQAPTSCRYTITTDKRLPWQLVARNIFEKVRLVYFSLKCEGRRGVLILNGEGQTYCLLTSLREGTSERGNEQSHERLWKNKQRQSRSFTAISVSSGTYYSNYGLPLLRSFY